MDLHVTYVTYLLMSGCLFLLFIKFPYVLIPSPVTELRGIATFGGKSITIMYTESKMAPGPIPPPIDRITLIAAQMKPM